MLGQMWVMGWADTARTTIDNWRKCRLVRVVGDYWVSTPDDGQFVNEVGLVCQVERKDGRRWHIHFTISRWLSVQPLGAL
jgi:hypothetical protein